MATNPKMKVYHNPRCSKSRLALEYLSDRNIDYDVVEYLKNDLSYEELNSVLQKLNMSAYQLIRRNEAIFKSEFKGVSEGDKDWISVLLEHPKLIERPIIELGDKAVIGRPAEEIEKLLV